MASTVLPASLLRLILLLAITIQRATSQQQIQPSPDVHRQFEVASIKPSKPGAVARDARISFRAGRFEALNVTLTTVVDYLSGYTGRVEGGPSWAGSDRYDIVASTDGEAPSDQRLLMVRALLEDRFKLAIHHDAKEQLGLVLAVGKNLPNLHPSQDREATQIRQGNNRELIFQAVSMGVLVNYLHQVCRTTVTDQTHVTGKFDFTLDINSAINELANQSAPHQNSFGDFVRAAVEDFGFRVETQKVTVDVTVIDHVERPSEN